MSHIVENIRCIFIYVEINYQVPSLVDHLFYSDDKRFIQRTVKQTSFPRNMCPVCSDGSGITWCQLTFWKFLVNSGINTRELELLDNGRHKNLSCSWTISYLLNFYYWNPFIVHSWFLIEFLLLKNQFNSIHAFI